MVTQNIQSWFGGGADLLTYFENNFEKNTIGTFKAPASAVKRVPVREDLIESLGNIMVSALVAGPKSGNLKTIPFNFLEADTQKHLKEAVCEGIQHMVMNRNVWERINSSSVTTSNFTLNTDSTGWLLTADMFGQIARTAVVASGIRDYEWVVEDQLFTGSTNGNVKIIGKADLDTIKLLTI